METDEQVTDEEFQDIEEDLENGEITSAEAGFMAGYLQSEEE